jgi:spore maturation protein CgeB
MRSFEVPGVGGIGLFPFTPDHDLYFVNGKEIFLYKDMNECAEKCKELLSLSVADVKKIRVAARSKSISSGYSYRDRTSQALTEICNLLS